MLALYGPNSPIDLHLQHTKWGVGVALLFVTLPFVARSVQPVLLELDHEVEEAAASLGARGAFAFRKIVLPLAFPAIFASLRVAIALAWVTIVVAELIDARMPSLGYLLALSGAYPRVPTMLVSIGTVGLLVLVSDLLALLLHARATRWMGRAA